MPRMIDGDKLRMTMRRVPSPVTIVTAAGPDEMRGITVGSFTSVSLDPPLVSFNVALDAQMYDLIVEAEHFVVHILSDRQAQLSTHFAVPDRSGEEQFAPFPYRLDANGTPILEDVLAVFFCAHYATYPAGDHTLVVGQVFDIAASVDGSPLVYFDRSYRRLGSLRRFILPQR